MSNSQLNRLKSLLKSDTEVTLSSVFADSNDENNFPHILLLTNTKIQKFEKVLQIIHQLI